MNNGEADNKRQDNLTDGDTDKILCIDSSAVSQKWPLCSQALFRELKN